MKLIVAAVALLSSVVGASAGDYTFTSSAHKTSIATIVDTLTPGEGVSCSGYLLYNFSTSQRLFWRKDGTDPAVNQDGSFVVPPPGSIYINIDYPASPPVIKVVTTLGATYTLECH